MSEFMGMNFDGMGSDMFDAKSPSNSEDLNAKAKIMATKYEVSGEDLLKAFFDSMEDKDSTLGKLIKISPAATLIIPIEIMQLWEKVVDMKQKGEL